MDLLRQCLNIATDTRHARWVRLPLYLADAFLCCLIVWKVPYTEIDWKAYMQQMETYLGGELDYLKIQGDTGPLVYPAAHVYLYRLLHALTARGSDIFLAQIIFVGVYLCALGFVMQCYRAAGAPPYLLPLLILSKRLHSIFILRLFNDSFAVLFLFATIYAYQRRQWTLGTVAYSLGLGTKMSLLLALPAIGMILWLGAGRDRALRQAALMGQLQILLGLPFLMAAPRSYLVRAFELSRQFMFKWTVNWRFVGEETFLSQKFSQGLLAAHAVLLVAFISFKWLSPMGTSVVGALQELTTPPPIDAQLATAKRTNAKYIMTTVLASMLVGCLCARSLHYQFYAYIAWSTPFLLWRGGLHPIAICLIWAVQEWAWNVYPSTSASSMAVVVCLALATMAAFVSPEERSTLQLKQNVE